MPTSALEALGGLTGRLVWLGLIHSLWIGLLVGSGVALIFQIGPRITHGARHAILLVAMLIAVTGPIAMATAQHLGLSRTERGAAETAGTLLAFRVESGARRHRRDRTRPKVERPRPSGARARDSRSSRGSWLGRLMGSGWRGRSRWRPGRSSSLRCARSCRWAASAYADSVAMPGRPRRPSGIVPAAWPGS